MKYKLVIFDFDGTLANSFPWFLQMMNSVAIKYNFKQVPPEAVESLRSLSAMQLVRHLEIPIWKIPLIANYIRQQMGKDREGITRFDGVDELLRQLHANGNIIALVTSNSYANVSHVLGQDNLDLITHIECDVSMLGKRGSFRRVLKRSGLRAEEIISIGDEIRDIEAANAERIPFGAVSWGYTHINALKAHSPAEVFTQVSDIFEQVS